MFGLSLLQWSIIAVAVVLAYIIIFSLNSANRLSSTPMERAMDDNDQRESLRAQLQAAEDDLDNRPRLRAGTLPTINQGSK